MTARQPVRYGRGPVPAGSSPPLPRWQRLGGAVVFASLAACSSTPTYVTPTIDLPSAFGEAAADWALAMPRDDAPRGAWWAVFGDPVLDALQARIEVSNESLRKALAQLAQARAVVGQARAGWWPSLGAVGSTTRERTSGNVEGRALAGKTVDDHLLGLSATWEPDVFGRIGAQVSGAEASAQASNADLEALRLALHAELATDYFALRFNEMERALLERTLANAARALAIAQGQFAAGFSSALDLAEASAIVESVKAQAIDLGLEHAQLTHAIATLIGVPAAGFRLDAGPPPWRLPEIAAGLPSRLLERRPDIAAAERRVAASNAQVGVARAAFFPRLTLALLGGVESSQASRLIGAPSRFWSLGPALALTLVDGGRRDSELAGARAGYDATVADYRRTVLAALNEVEDQLAALRVLRQEGASAERAASLSERAAALAVDRYRAGAVSYLPVAVAQGNALQSQRAVVLLQRRQWLSSVALLKALGGGLEAP